MSHPKFLANGDDPLELAARDLEAIAGKIRQQIPKRPQLNHLSQTTTESEIQRRFAHRLIRERREREQLLGANLFSDPAWDILLDLFVAHIEGKETSVSSLCIAAAAPTSTALRWIRSMVQSGLLASRDDPQDGRRTWIALAPQTVQRMEALITVWAGNPNR